MNGTLLIRFENCLPFSSPGIHDYRKQKNYMNSNEWNVQTPSPHHYPHRKIVCMNSKAYRRESIRHRMLYPIQWTRRFTRDILDWLTEKLQEIFLEEEVEFVQSAPSTNIRTSSFSSKQGITSGKCRTTNTNNS
jgi:hypothetical protein